jgi:hypothetical protein
MDNFPPTEQEFEEYFKTEDDCVNYLLGIRWPGGPSCQKCGSTKLSSSNYNHIFVCSICANKIRPLAGTIFQDTHLPLKVWFKIMWFMMSQKYGSNAIGLARILNLSPTTTWNILHKLRRTMVRAERELLEPVVEVDESYIGGPEHEKSGRGEKKKSLIVLAVELSSDQKNIGRIRLASIPNANVIRLCPS